MIPRRSRSVLLNAVLVSQRRGCPTDSNLPPSTYVTVRTNCVTFSVRRSKAYLGPRPQAGKFRVHAGPETLLCRDLFE